MIEIKITGGIVWTYDPEIRISGPFDDDEIDRALKRLEIARKRLVALSESSRVVSAAEDTPKMQTIEHDGISHPVSVDPSAYKWITPGMEEE